MANFLDSGPKSTGLVFPNAGGIDIDQFGFPILDNSSRCGDIRDQSRKLCKMAQILHVLGPKII